jgi:arylsulfatase A-like enzyme
MVVILDRMIGQVIQAYTDAGLWDDTVPIFTSDSKFETRSRCTLGRTLLSFLFFFTKERHGRAHMAPASPPPLFLSLCADSGIGPGSNYPLRGMKVLNWEGGINAVEFVRGTNSAMAPRRRHDS